MSVLLKLCKRLYVGFVDVNSQLIVENCMNKCIYVTKVCSCHLLFKYSLSTTMELVCTVVVI